MKIQLWYQDAERLRGPMSAAIRAFTPGELGSNGRQMARISSHADEVGMMGSRGGPYDFFCEELPSDRRLPLGTYAWSRIFPADCNKNKPEINVVHAELHVVIHSDPYVVWCPVCEEGKLSTQRPFGLAGAISRRDECSHCKQGFLYRDTSINGRSFWPDRNRFEREEIV